MHDSIVLLGYSGVGKDTTFDTLNSRYPGVYTNVKFGIMAKVFVSRALNVPIVDVEDRYTRQQKTLYGVSPLDLLTVLYKGCTPELTKAHIEYALNSIRLDAIPVFTDVRRKEEADAVCEHLSNPLFVYLWTPEIEPSVNDGNILSIAKEYNAKPVCRLFANATEVVNTIEQYLG